MKLIHKNILRTVFISIMGVCVTFCNKSNIIKVDKYEALYPIIENYLGDSLSIGNRVICSLNSLLDTIPDHFPEDIISPPSPDTIGYSIAELKKYCHKGYIDSIDINYMYEQVKRRENYSLDSTKILAINSNSIRHKKELHQGFITLSTPLISKDGQTLIINMDYIGDSFSIGEKQIWWNKRGRWVQVYSKIRWIYNKAI